jgi:hypothetical protein
MFLYEFLKTPPVQSVWMQRILIYRGTFVHFIRDRKDIHGADQDKSLGSNALQRRYERLNISGILSGCSVGDPLLSGSSRADNEIESATLNRSYVNGAVELRKLLLPLQEAANESTATNKSRVHWRN